MSKYVEVAFAPGDSLYVLQNGSIVEMTIEFIYIAKRNRYHARAENITFNFREPAIGREVFFTREEAEEAQRQTEDYQ